MTHEEKLIYVRNEINLLVRARQLSRFCAMNQLSISSANRIRRSASRQHMPSTVSQWFAIFKGNEK
jgi:hypothetical protein